MPVFLGSLIAALENCGDRILHVATNADDMICLRLDTDKDKESCPCVDDLRVIDDRVSLRRGMIDNADTTA